MSSSPSQLPPSTTATAVASDPTNSERDTSAKSAIDFLTAARGLKTTLRTGWIRQEASDRIESVADHSWRITLMSLLAATSTQNHSSSRNSSSSSSSSGEDATTTTPTTTTSHLVDNNKVVKMALVHDLAEARVGDITPHCGVSDQDKHSLELKAMQEMVQHLPTLIASEFLELWKEYEAGTSEEAKLVKDMDKLEMILQALEYENEGKNGKSLDGFFESTRGKWRTEIGKAWGEEIESRRSGSVPAKRSLEADKQQEENESKKPKAT